MYVLYVTTSRTKRISVEFGSLAKGPCTRQRMLWSHVFAFLILRDLLLLNVQPILLLALRLQGPFIE